MIEQAAGIYTSVAGAPSHGRFCVRAFLLIGLGFGLMNVDRGGVKIRLDVCHVIFLNHLDAGPAVFGDLVSRAICCALSVSLYCTCALHVLDAQRRSALQHMGPCSASVNGLLPANGSSFLYTSLRFSDLAYRSYKEARGPQQASILVSREYTAMEMWPFRLRHE